MTTIDTMPVQHNILLVDDRPENLFSLEAMLTDDGRNFLTATSGQEALKIALKEELSLILMDVQMPEMDGFETAALLKSNERTQKTPIIFVTAINKEKKYVEQGLEEGAVDYLFKPLDTEVTRYKVSNLLRLYQQQIELNDKNLRLELLNSEKNHLLGMAAHDLRNPLSVIFSLSNFIKDDYAHSLNPTVSKYIGVIYSCSNFMLELINNILDVSKIEEGKPTMNVTETDLIQLVSMNIEINKVISEKKHIEIAFNHSIDELKMNLDPGKMDQVMNNLISNAVKFSMGNTKVSVNVGISEEKEVQISVTDQGQGIPEKEIEKLFKPFQKTSVRATAGESSTGLGLCIVKKIVEAHNGNIWVESKVGQGSTFHVNLPIDNGMKPGEG